MDAGVCGMACTPGYTCSSTGCGDWADWPMPNAVVTGLPHPASYTMMPGYVVDAVTSLWWQHPVDVNNTLSLNCSAGCTLAEAVAYCANLTLAGHSDWRVPTRIELVSIVDATTLNPTINVAAFAGTVGNNVWTSSPFPQAPGNAWYVDFVYGDLIGGPVSGPNHVRCVR